MNIIFGVICKTETVNASVKTINKLNPNKLFVIADETHFDIFKSIDCCVEVYDYTQSRNFGYNKKIENDSLMAIDNDLLIAFEPYMENALGQFSRISNGVDLISFDYIKQKMYEAILYWNTIIEKYNIDVFISHNIPHTGFDYVIYALCKIKNIKTYIMTPSKVVGYSYIYNDINIHNIETKNLFLTLKEEYKNKDEQDIQLPDDFLTVYEKYTAEDVDITPYFMKPENRFAKQSAQKPLFVRAVEYCKICIKNGIVKSVINWFRLKKIEIDNKNKKAKINKELSIYLDEYEKFTAEPDLNKKFIYFPLHMQPEAVTNPLGGYFQNQELALRMISNALPSDVFIYVKENPYQTLRGRTLEFPKKLSQIKNVVLVSKNTDTYLLIKKCIATASITGTVLWESIFKNKPAIMFGSYITMYAPYVYKVDNLDDCKNIIDDIINNKINISKKELKLFLLALSQTTFKGHIHGSKKPADEMREDSIANAFAKRISGDIN